MTDNPQREWTLTTMGGTPYIALGTEQSKMHYGERITVVPKADRDRLQRELDDARAQHLTLSNQALDATTKVDRLQREVERLTVWASHKREHIYKVEGERDRLQRECDKLRRLLRKYQTLRHDDAITPMHNSFDDEVASALDEPTQ